MPDLPKVLVLDSRAAADVAWSKQLVVQLRALKDELTVWDQDQILPGDDPLERLLAEAATAKLAVLLVSPELLASELLTNPSSKTTRRTHKVFGEVIEVRSPDGLGLRFSSDGSFIGFLEP